MGTFYTQHYSSLWGPVLSNFSETVSSPDQRSSFSFTQLNTCFVGTFYTQHYSSLWGPVLSNFSETVSASDQRSSFSFTQFNTSFVETFYTKHCISLCVQVLPNCSHTVSTQTLNKEWSYNDKTAMDMNLPLQVWSLAQRHKPSDSLSGQDLNHPPPWC
mgnify:CR=1 FL=1